MTHSTGGGGMMGYDHDHGRGGGGGDPEPGTYIYIYTYHINQCHQDQHDHTMFAQVLGCPNIPFPKRFPFLRFQRSRKLLSWPKRTTDRRLPGVQWQMKVYRNPQKYPTKNVMILVATVTGRGQHPKYMSICFKTYQEIVMRKNVNRLCLSTSFFNMVSSSKRTLGVT